MALSDVVRKNEGGNVERLGGVALNVISTNSTKEEFSITGTLVFPSMGKEAGEEVTILSTRKEVAGNAENIKGGFGDAVGSTVLIEGVIPVKKDDQTIYLGRWFTTAVSALKKMQPSTRHDKREIITAQISAPTINFKNPVQGPGEPERISFAVNQLTANLWVASERKFLSFDREYLSTRLGQLREDVTPQVHVSAMHTEYAEEVSSVDEAIAKAVEFADKSGHTAVIRAWDGEGFVLTNTAFFPYGKPDGTLEKNLKERGLFRNVTNADLQKEVAAGSARIEVIPGTQIPFVGKGLQAMVAQFKESDPERLISHDIKYGKNAGDNYIDAIVTYAPLGDDEGSDNFIVSNPVRRDNTIRTLAYIPTANFDLEDPKLAALNASSAADKDDDAPADAPADSQAADEGPAGASAHPPVDHNESFDAGGFDDYDFVPPSEAAQAQQAAPQTGRRLR